MNVEDISAPVSATSEHQRRVDEIVAQARAEAKPDRRSIFREPPPRPKPSPNVLDHRVSEELQMIRRHLDQLGGVLACEPLLLHKYAIQLQSIDLMTQLLGHLADIVATGDKELAVEGVSLHDLKQRLRRKPLRAVGG